VFLHHLPPGKQDVALMLFILIRSLFGVLLIALATALYFFRDVVRSVDGDPWMFVPANVAVVVEMDHPEAAFNRFQDGNDIGTSLQSVAEIQDLVASKVFLGRRLPRWPHCSNDPCWWPGYSIPLN